MDVPGSRLGRIRVETLIGEGGMGLVYRGFDEGLERPVALKVVAHAHRGPTAKARFLREARTLSRLDHRGICRIHDLIEGEDHDVLVLEYLDGRSLAAAIATDSLAAGDRWRIGEEIARAVAAAHAAGIVHRDLKPQNVMLTADGAKVLDFGIARWAAGGTDESTADSAIGQHADPTPAPRGVAAAPTPAASGEGDMAGVETLDLAHPTFGRQAPDAEAQVTRAGMVVGTLRYMSPEQARGERLGPASDVYSLGLVLLEMETGVPPNAGPIGIDALRERAAKGIGEPPAGIDRELRRLLRSMLALDPRARPDALAVAEALRRRRAAPRRRRLLRWSAVAAAALALATIPWLARQKSGGPDPAEPVRLALLPVRTTVNDDRNLALLAASVTDLVHARLQGIDRLVVRPPSYGDGVADPQQFARFAEAAGVHYVLSGTLAPTAELAKARLEVHLHELVPPGRMRATPLGAFDVPFLAAGGIEDVVRVRDAVARALLDALLPAIALPAEDPVRPRDPEAYRLTLLAEASIQSATCDGGAASRLLERSLELDPEYAPAWTALGWAAYSEVASCGQDASSYQRALEAADRALAIAPELADPQLLKATILVETGQLEAAYQLVRTGRARHPESPDLAFGEVYALTYAGFLDSAVASLDEVARLDPLYLTRGGWTANARLYRGDHEAFLANLPADDTPIFRFYRGWVALRRGDATGRLAARAALEPAFRVNPNDLFARLARAAVAILDGDRQQARLQVLHIAAERRELGGRDGEMTFKEAQLLALAGAPAEAAAQLLLAVEQGFACPRCLAEDPFLAGVRAEAGYAAALGAATSRHAAFAERFGLVPEPARSTASAPTP